jgi:hypothetical protein
VGVTSNCYQLLNNEVEDLEGGIKLLVNSLEDKCEHVREMAVSVIPDIYYVLGGNIYR